jgi:tRNA/tmRNA/rRNA uracil-C5-methylase (TrmA/RlmC/RlmD family)
MTIAFDAIDSFAENPEVYEHLVTTKTKHLRMKVKFHADRPCRSAKAFLQYGGQSQKPLKDPWVSDDRTEIMFEMRKPKEGSEYAIEWNW